MKSANIMKISFLILIVPLILALFSPDTNIFATDLDSSNYKIVGATTSGGGGIQNSANYNMISTAGEISGNPRNYSTNYRLDQDPSANFVAAVPGIQCFETDTDGTTDCTSGPDDLLTGGMVAICGGDGCYDKARFEIEGVEREPDANTVALLGLDQVSGSGAYLLDASSSANNGTPYGTTYVSDGVTGGTRDFDGIDDYINLGQDSSLDLTTTGTVSVWVDPDRDYPSDTTSTKYRGIVAKTTGGGTGQQSYFIDWSGTNTTRRLRGHIGDSIGLLGPNINFEFQNGWNHIVLTWDGTNIILYANGAQIGSAPQVRNAQVLAQDVHIGRAFNGASYTWDGLIDDVYISNRALTADEILTQYEYGTRERSNPEDTLYMVQISEDNFVSDIKCIDGSTFRPKTLSSCDINDFRTEAQWETEDFNVQGLAPSTQYYIRASALHGDFTQSDFSSSQNATTTAGSITFDIDIATSSGITTESSPPYSIAFTGAYELIGGSSAITAPNLIWLDIESNSTGGVAILQHGKNGGLTSATTTQTITSATANLDTTDDGFGLQNFYIDYDDSSPYYGDLTATTNYSGSTNSVGIVNTTNSKIYDGDGPIVSGRTGIKILAKPGTDKTSATDYTENIYFVIVPRY